MTVRGGIVIVIRVLSGVGRVRVMGPPEEGEGEEDWEEMRRERRVVVVCSRVCRAEVGALATCGVEKRRDTA